MPRTGVCADRLGYRKSHCCARPIVLVQRICDWQEKTWQIFRRLIQTVNGGVEEGGESGPGEIGSREPGGEVIEAREDGRSGGNSQPQENELDESGADGM